MLTEMCYLYRERFSPLLVIVQRVEPLGPLRGDFFTYCDTIIRYV